MRNYRTLIVWERAHQFTLDVYRATKTFSADERYGLTSQLRRASSSICANIAEGCGRSSDSDFARFLHIAAGSASEADYHLLLARDLGYLPPRRYDELNSLLTEVRRMLTTFIKKLDASRG
jgi:four helix bundle protein